MRTVSVKLMADAVNFSRNVRGASGDVKTLVSELGKANKAGHLDNLTDSATGLGLGLVGAAGAAIKFSSDFEKQMSSVKAATHASADSMDQLRQAALKAGADTQFSATEAAKGIEELSKAGVSTTDILGGGLSGALDLAAAGGLDVGEAAETAASALTQFKLKGQDVPHVADLLAAAAGKAQGSVQDMGQALNQSGLVAAQMGLSVEETTGTLAAFASAGLMGSDAGTSFKQSLLMLANPTDKARELMGQLGINAYDASGQFVGITNLAGQLKAQLGGLTQEQRNSALATIFGSDAIRAASILYENGSDGIQKWIDKTNDAGYAAETAKMKTDNLAGDVERLQGSLETLAIQSGGGANDGLRVLAKSANGLVDQFAQLPSGISGTVTVLTLLGGAAVLGSVGWVKYRKSTADALDELRKTGPVGEKAAVGLEKTTKWAGRAAIAFAATQAAAAGVTAAFGEDVNAQTEAFAQSLTQWAQNGTKAGEAARLLGDDFEHLSFDLGTLDSGFWTGLGNGISGTVESLTGLGSVADESLTKAKERLTALDNALTGMVQSGNTAQAAQIFDKLAAEAKKSGVSVDELKKGLPQYAAALETAGKQSITTAGDVKQVGDAADTAEQQVEELKDAFDQLFGAQMSIDRANIKYQQGIAALTKELKTGRRELSLDTQEGQKNRSAVLDQIDTINDLRSARIEHGWSLDAANKKYVKDIDGLRAQMRAANFTEKQINELTGAYRKIPSKATTTISTPGLPSADKGIKDYDKKLDSLARQVKTKIVTDGDAEARRKLESLLILQQAAKKGISVGAARSAFNKNAGYARGGWTGPGAMYDEAGVVHADEFVINKPSRRKFERNNPGVLDHINAHGEMPMYAGGGLVMPFPYNVRQTQIISKAEALSKVVPAIPSSGRTSDFIVRAVHAAFPGLAVLSKDRPGSRTLTGNVSYHARGRAVDFPPSRALAEWWNAHYMSRTKELITPWNSLNIWNGRRHTYTGAVYRQHNFAGGNAHDHIAMAGGGIIGEPVVGVGASGRTYSFGERGPETVVPGTSTWLAQGGGGGSTMVQQSFHVVVQVPATANQAEVGRAVVGAIQAYEQRSGSSWRKP